MDRKREGNSIHPRFKLWLSTESSEGVFGDGKWRLLDAIGRNGSLRSAAAELGISYRKAWGDLEKAERCLGVALIEKHRGGSGGGETTLTDAGKAWLHGYSNLRTDVEKVVSIAFERHIINLEREKT